MERADAIRANQDAMDALARLSEELHAIDVLICRFGQTSQRWYNPEMVRRLNRTRKRLLIEREIHMAARAYAAQFI